jgi:hypothetical protein
MYRFHDMLLFDNYDPVRLYNEPKIVHFPITYSFKIYSGSFFHGCGFGLIQSGSSIFPQSGSGSAKFLNPDPMRIRMLRESAFFLYLSSHGSGSTKSLNPDPTRIQNPVFFIPCKTSREKLPSAFGNSFFAGLWIRIQRLCGSWIRIRNPDPGARKLGNFSGKNHT